MLPASRYSGGTKHAGSEYRYDTLYWARSCYLGLSLRFLCSSDSVAILRKLDDGAQAQAIGLFAKRLGFVMPFWYAGSFLLLLAGTVVRWRGEAMRC